MRTVKPGTEEQVLQLLKEGKKCREISALCNVSISYATTIRQKNNLPKGKRGQPPKLHKKPPPPLKNRMNTKSEYGDAF